MTEQPQPRTRALRLLLCAATRWEARPLAARLGLSARAAGRFEGAFAGHRLVLLETGMGPTRALAALDALPQTLAFDAALSVGFAGALQPKMEPGDLVCDLRGCDAEWPPRAREIAARLGRAVHFGRIIHSDEVLRSPDEKLSAGRRERAGAVDMETQSVKAWSATRGCQALAVRVVLDAVDEPLPQLPAGEDAGALLRYAASHWRQLPWLSRIGLRQRRGMMILCDFLAQFLEAL